MAKKLPSDLILVVGRQFGSGGRMLGKRLAEAYGLRYFDKEVLAHAAERFGFSQKIFARYDEKRPSVLRSLMTNAFGVQDAAYIPSPMSSESIYKAQSSVIRNLADEGGAVFVGRSADYILRHHPHLCSIFLHSDLERRAEVLLKRGDAESIEKARDIARYLDRKREDFYNYYTGRKWGHATNYDLTLDTTILGPEKAFEVISHYLEQRFAEEKE